MCPAVSQPPIEGAASARPVNWSPDLTLSSLSEVFDYSPLCVLQVDTELNVVYANPVAYETVGAEKGQKLSLLDVIDARDRETLRSQFASRMGGHADEYELTFRNLRTNQKIPVRVAAVPVRDGNGAIVGSFGFFHNIFLETTFDTFDAVIANAKQSDEILQGIAQALNGIIPYDFCTLAAYNDDNTRSRIVFRFPENSRRSPVRWLEHSPQLAGFVRRNQIVAVNDLAAFLKEHEFVLEPDLRSDPTMDPADCSFLHRPVLKGGKVVASLGIFRKHRDAFTAADCHLFEKLPIDRAIMMASFLESNQRLAFREDFLSVLMKSKNLQLFDDSVARLIVDRLSQLYDWDNISIFRAEPARNLFRLAAQHSSVAIVFPERHEQPMDRGFLGWVWTRKADAVSSDVQNDPQFKDVFCATSPNTRSELCMRVMQGNRIAGLLNIEDSRRNAFCDEERISLEQLIRRTGGILERRRVENLVRATFQCTPSAVIAAFPNGIIDQVNPAASELLGYTEAELGGMMLRDLFVEPALADAVVQAKVPTSADVELRRKDRTQVKVMLGGSCLANCSGVVISCRDVSSREREEHLEVLREIYYDLASETRPPLALVFDWLRDVRQLLLSKRDDSGDEIELIDKAVQQLRKIELTYERVTRASDKRATAAENMVVLNIRDILEDEISELPRAEGDKIGVKWEATRELVRGDPEHVPFVLATTISYLLRILPQNQRIDIHAENYVEDNKTMLRVVVIGPRAAPMTTGASKDDLYFGKIRSDISIGIDRIDCILNEVGGSCNRSNVAAGKERFEFCFPVLEGE